MASKRRIRRNMCEGKRHYHSRKAALTALIRLLRARPDGAMLRSYRCRFCRAYHFGHVGNIDEARFGHHSRLAV